VQRPIEGGVVLGAAGSGFGHQAVGRDEYKAHVTQGLIEGQAAKVDTVGVNIGGGEFQFCVKFGRVRTRLGDDVQRLGMADT